MFVWFRFFWILLFVFLILQHTNVQCQTDKRTNHSSENGTIVIDFKHVKCRPSRVDQFVWHCVHRRRSSSSTCSTECLNEQEKKIYRFKWQMLNCITIPSLLTHFHWYGCLNFGAEDNTHTRLDCNIYLNRKRRRRSRRRTNHYPPSYSLSSEKLTFFIGKCEVTININRKTSAFEVWLCVSR